MRFYFIRHGQSANNLLYSSTGSDKGRDCDPALTQTGEKQAHLLADFIKQSDFCLTHLYTSLMVRSVSTGSIVADKLGMPISAWVDLHEEGGIYLADDRGNRIGQPGKDRSYFKQYFPKLTLPDSVNSTGWWNRPFEEEHERPARARRFLGDLLSRHGGTEDCVAAISHGGFYNQFLSVLLHLPANQDVWFELNNTGITRIDFIAERVYLIFQNRIDFLPGKLIT